MLNEVRSLLLNQAAPAGGLYVGEEPIAADFHPPKLPDYLQHVRTCLFGATPDREMLNYRGRQLLTLIHSTELRAYLKDFDSRVSYDFTGNVYGAGRAFVPVIVSAAGNVGELAFLPRPESPDGQGRLRWQWTVKVQVSEVVITANGDPLPRSYASPDSVSVPYTLPGVSSQVQLSQAAIGDSWNISALLRPTRSTGAILRLLNSLSEEVKGSLFGDTNQTETTQHETLRDLRRIVNQHFEAPHRLAAYVLALVYRTREYVL